MLPRALAAHYSISRRRIDPQDPRRRVARVAVAMRRLAREAEGVPSMQNIARATQRQFDAAFEHVTDFLSDVFNLPVAALTRLEDMNVRLQQTVAARQNNAPERDASAAALASLSLPRHRNPCRPFRRR